MSNAPIDKWHIKSLVMTNSLVSTGWGHHNGRVPKLVDGLVLGTSGAIHVSSSLTSPTTTNDIL